MIRLCDEHFNELKKKWGNVEAIKTAYGNYEIVEPSYCDDWRCIQLQNQSEQFVRCPHCLKAIKVILKTR